MRKQRPAMVQTKVYSLICDVIWCHFLYTQNQYHFLFIAAADMARMALTADVVPTKPIAPKPSPKPTVSK